jgi:hypothetical protein
VNGPIFAQKPERAHFAVRLLKRVAAGGFMEEPQRLRELAAWYREFAEKTGNPDIWEARLRMAEDLEAQAFLLERRQIAVAAE